MAKHNAANTRIKREYLDYLKEAMRRDDADAFDTPLLGQL